MKLHNARNLLILSLSLTEVEAGVTNINSEQFIYLFSGSGVPDRQRGPSSRSRPRIAIHSVRLVTLGCYARR